VVARLERDGRLRRLAAGAMWTSGSPISSTTVRSSSVSSPLVTKETFFPKSRARSRARRSIFWNVGLIGIMRSAIAVDCNSFVMRLNWATLRWSVESTAADCRELSINWLCTITNSPTTSISESSFSVFTRTVADVAALAGPLAALPAAGRPAGAGIAPAAAADSIGTTVALSVLAPGVLSEETRSAADSVGSSAGAAGCAATGIGAVSVAP